MTRQVQSTVSTRTETVTAESLETETEIAETVTEPVAFIRVQLHILYQKKESHLAGETRTENETEDRAAIQKMKQPIVTDIWIRMEKGIQTNATMIEMLDRIEIGIGIGLGISIEWTVVERKMTSLSRIAKTSTIVKEIAVIVQTDGKMTANVDAIID